MRKLLFLGSAAMLGVALGLFGGCGGGGGSQTPTETPTGSGSASTAASAPSASAAPTTSASAAATTWDQMDHAQRLNVMKTVVLPKLGADFKEFNAKKYDNFGCVTCHGEKIKQGNAKMPNPDLPHLSFTDNFKKHRAKNNAMVEFMMKKVEPDMAAAVGEKPFDPATKTGFGCAECHIMGP